MTLIGRIARTVAHIAAPRVARDLERLRGLRQVPAVAAVATTTTPTTSAPAPKVAIKGEAPEVEDIQAAARLYDQAREQANTAARTKRKAEKTLKGVADGTYGPVTIERVPSGRQTADLDKIRAIFAEHGLGDLPMKACAPSLTITWADQTTTDQPAPALAAA